MDPACIVAAHMSAARARSRSYHGLDTAWTAGRTPMKTLFLVRHAKSGRDDPTLADRDRPLNARGLNDAPAMGKRLAKHVPDGALMVSSPALRALTTAELFADALGRARQSIVIDERIYASTADTLLALICGFDDNHDCAMLFGHNPEFSELAGQLAGKAIEMPTCAVARFRFDVPSWAAVGRGAPERFKLDKPEH
jgi:phosphohistidine phosphatase